MNTKRLVCRGLVLGMIVTLGCAKSPSGNSGGGSGGSSSSTGGKNGSTGGNNGAGGGNSSTGGNNGSGSGGNNNGTGGSVSSTGGNNGTGGSNSSTGGNSASGGSTGAGGTTSSTGGAAGAPVQKLCATKTKIVTPIFQDFESYDGMVDATKFSAAFGGTTVNSGNAYTGIYGYPESSGGTAPSLSIGGGHPPSNWAGYETLAASMWGMGGGIWMGCADASAYKGISFWVRGTSGKGTFQFSISMESTQLPSGANNAGGGTCPGVAASPGVNATCVDPTMMNIPLTSDWAQVSIMWTDFTPGLSGTTSVVPNGDNIVGMAWSVPLAYEADPSKPADAGVYIPVPQTLTINIDDITFIQ